MLLLKATERNWGLIGPGEWEKRSWKVNSDGTYLLKTTYRPVDPRDAESVGETVKGELSAEQMETLQEACDKSRIVLNGYNFYMEDTSIIDPEGKLVKAGFNKLLFSTREYFGAFNAVGVTGDGTAFGAADQRRNGSVETTENDG